jgi:hypothetical protein
VARAIDDGKAGKARAAMEQVLGYTQTKLAKRGIATGPRTSAAKTRDKRDVP